MSKESYGPLEMFDGKWEGQGTFTMLGHKKQIPMTQHIEFTRVGSPIGQPVVTQSIRMVSCTKSPDFGVVDRFDGYMIWLPTQEDMGMIYRVLSSPRGLAFIDGTEHAVEADVTTFKLDAILSPKESINGIIQTPSLFHSTPTISNSITFSVDAGAKTIEYMEASTIRVNGKPEAHTDQATLHPVEM